MEIEAAKEGKPQPRGAVGIYPTFRNPIELNTPEHVQYSNRFATVSVSDRFYEFTDVEWLLPQLGTSIAHSFQKGRRVISGYESLSLCSERLPSGMRVEH